MPYYRSFFDIAVYAERNDASTDAPSFAIEAPWEQDGAAEFGDFGRREGRSACKIWFHRSIHVHADDEEAALTAASEQIERPARPADSGDGWRFLHFGELTHSSDIEKSDRDTYLRCRDPHQPLEPAAPPPAP